MNIVSNTDISAIATLLLAGKIGVVRTDTIYGVVCVAINKDAVERIFRAKGRDDHKSPIVLVANQQQLFDIPDDTLRQFLANVWPDKTSVILPGINAPEWITRGNNSVAYRNPNDAWLTGLLARTGPLIAPSANLQGLPVARNIDEAIGYFGDTVDFYVDGGLISDNTPSRLLRIGMDGTVERLR